MLHRLPLILTITIAALMFGATTAQAAPCWQPPVAGVVTDPFREPSCPYCAGNRGLEYRVGTRSMVRAVESGTVTWAGVLAGTRYVVVRHADGWRATYGNLASSSLGAGDVVLEGRSVGTASGTFHFGVRDGSRYLDPAPYMGRLVGRPRLIPTDGTAARPAPPSATRCESSRPPNVSRIAVR